MCKQAARSHVHKQPDRIDAYPQEREEAERRGGTERTARKVVARVRRCLHVVLAYAAHDRHDEHWDCGDDVRDEHLFKKK